MTGETADRHPGEHTLDKDDVKGCFTGTLIIGCLFGAILLLGLFVWIAITLQGISQDPGYRNGGRDPTDDPTSETSP